MIRPRAAPAPPCCPNPACRYHTDPVAGWCWQRDGTYTRRASPQVIHRYRCGQCGRRFSEQTFRTSYWLRRPDLLPVVFRRLLGCTGMRQMARELGVSPSTVMRLSTRLGRHCLLWHAATRPRGAITEPLVLDGFVSFEYSQYYPTEFHTAVGAHSHFVYGMTESELRRSGRMTDRQRHRRAQLESQSGRPDPRSREKEVSRLLRIVTEPAHGLELWSDEHQDYPRALRRLAGWRITHRVTNSREPRTPWNRLFAVNLWDLLVRHSSANHKRETIAFSKRRQSAVERLWVMAVWRNWIKSFSERKRDASPAMRLGITDRRWTVEEVLARRLFVSQIELPDRWVPYYWRTIHTRQIPNGVEHRCRYAA